MKDTRHVLEYLRQCGERVETKSQKILGANHTFIEVTGENLVGGFFATSLQTLPSSTPIMNRTKCSSNLVFLETYNTEFHKIIITFTDQNDGILEIEGKSNLILILNE